MAVNSSPECAECGTPLSGYHYCINCGHDASGHRASTASAGVSGSKDTVADSAEVDVFSTPEAKVIAEQLAALVIHQTAQRAAGSPSAKRSVAKPRGRTTARGDAAPRVPRPRSPSAAESTTTRPGARAHRPPAPPARRRHADPVLQGRGLLVGFAVLALTLTTLALTQLLGSSDPAEGPRRGALVAAENETPTAIGQVSCWDGDSASVLAQCGLPTGLTGLAWVFPSIETAECAATGDDGGPRGWICRVTTPDGSEATVVYAELLSVSDGLSRYVNAYDNGRAERKERGARFVWRAAAADPEGAWEISSMYVDYPWAVDVSADSNRAARDAYRAIVFRDSDELLGVVG